MFRDTAIAHQPLESARKITRDFTPSLKIERRVFKMEYNMVMLVNRRISKVFLYIKPDLVEIFLYLEVCLKMFGLQTVVGEEWNDSSHQQQQPNQLALGGKV